MAEYFTKDGDTYKKVESTLFTQDEIDTNIIPKRLERERQKFADYDALKEKAGKVDSIKSEYETKLKEKDTAVSDLTGKLGKAQLETEKVRIVHKYKLPEDVHEFVTGENSTEMEQRAEKLAKGFKGGIPDLDKKPNPDGDKGNSDSTSLARNLFGKND